MIWPFIRQAAQAGFAISIEPTARGTFIVRARPVIVDTRRPATVRFASGLMVERESCDDAAAQILTCVCGELDLDAEEKRRQLEKQAHAEVRGRCRLEGKAAE